MDLFSSPKVSLKSRGGEVVERADSVYKTTPGVRRAGGKRPLLHGASTAPQGHGDPRLFRTEHAEVTALRRRYGQCERVGSSQ